MKYKSKCSYFTLLLNYFPFNLYNKFQIAICSKISVTLLFLSTSPKVKITKHPKYAKMNSKITQNLKSLSVLNVMGPQIKAVLNAKVLESFNSSTQWLNYLTVFYRKNSTLRRRNKLRKNSN
jgi:hypothetical protein